MKTLLLMIVLIQLCKNQIPIGVDCIFKEGDKMNCREYCSQYFKSQPQLAWYNITSHQCEPLKICSWYLHYYNYEANQCYTDVTMKQIVPSEYPQSLVRQIVATFYIDNICVNGEPQTGMFQDSPCYCFFLWQDSGKVDMNGYPYKCDQVIGPQKWKGYFINDLILGPNSTVLMYGQYTPEQLQIVYEQLKQKQLSQTYDFVYKYENPLLFLIQKEIPQQSLIREGQIIWVLIGVGFFYAVFAFSYLRQQSQIIKVTKKQLVKRIQFIIEDKKPILSNL